MSHLHEGILHAYIDGGLDETASVDTHLAGCARCRLRVEEAAALREEAAWIVRGAGTPASARESTRSWGVMRYAAVVVLAVGAGWLLRDAIIDEGAASVSSAAHQMTASAPGHPASGEVQAAGKPADAESYQQRESTSAAARMAAGEHADADGRRQREFLRGSRLGSTPISAAPTAVEGPDLEVSPLRPRPLAAVPVRNLPTVLRAAHDLQVPFLVLEELPEPLRGILASILASPAPVTEESAQSGGRARGLYPLAKEAGARSAFAGKPSPGGPGEANGLRQGLNGRARREPSRPALPAGSMLAPRTSADSAAGALVHTHHQLPGAITVETFRWPDTPETTSPDIVIGTFVIDDRGGILARRGGEMVAAIANVPPDYLIYLIDDLFLLD